MSAEYAKLVVRVPLRLESVIAARAKSLGVSISEYVRRMVFADLAQNVPEEARGPEVRR